MPALLTATSMRPNFRLAPARPRLDRRRVPDVHLERQDYHAGVLLPQRRRGAREGVGVDVGEGQALHAGGGKCAGCLPADALESTVLSAIARLPRLPRQ
ncbi:uncharacterized protein PG998_008798 [Apiospora kogelbergensis]|uniref:uncharacterized protein n=1 Tax=Apiospora kogelbergensis TaxID=1337665 RepID=UPI00312E10AE